MLSELSIEQVIASYATTVYGVALTHTARRADADDVFQEVFAAYWQSRPSLTSEEHRKAWLIRTTLNFCLKITQSSWAKKTVYADGEYGEGAYETDEYGADETVFSSTGAVAPAGSELPSADFPFQTEQQTALYAALRSLPAAYRTVVQLFYFEDLPIARIATILGEEQGTVKTRLSRARTQLREKLKGW
ncbi:MAG: sigma-70 family RNA polymerase sigma factor [Coriobacteriales bacterium]|jgi:RNA polymerase sigma-70 factor (ECF subfamily)|nr:sigma-70 family RNA polymerase sigma factor [Coriobacteriales bacterium]